MTRAYIKTECRILVNLIWNMSISSRNAVFFLHRIIKSETGMYICICTYIQRDMYMYIYIYITSKKYQQNTIFLIFVLTSNEAFPLANFIRKVHERIKE